MAGHAAQSIHVAHFNELFSCIPRSDSNIGLGSALSHSGSRSQPVCRCVFDVDGMHSC